MFFVVIKQRLDSHIVYQIVTPSNMFEMNALPGQGLLGISDCYQLLSIAIDYNQLTQSITIDNNFFCEFDWYRLPISIDINQ